MPIFEFDCLKCGNSFEELVGPSEDMSKFTCPRCKSRRVKIGLPSYYSPSIEKEYMGRAASKFHKALEMDPNNASYHEHVGFYYLRIGRYDDAERELNQALEILPDTPTYHAERKHVQQLLKRLEAKRRETAEAKSAFPFMRTEDSGEEEPCRYLNSIA